MNSGRKSKKSQGRRRIPFSSHRTKLQLSDEDRQAMEKAGYVCRWFNDMDGRVQRALAAGWEFVRQEEAMSVGQGALHEGSTDLNGKVSKVVSRGKDNVVDGVLMKIKKEFYDEDQEAKEEINRRVDDALRAGSPGGNVVENQYVPKGHTQRIG